VQAQPTDGCATESGLARASAAKIGAAAVAMYA
jgi:hypothetical protein